MHSLWDFGLARSTGTGFTAILGVLPLEFFSSAVSPVSGTDWCDEGHRDALKKTNEKKIK